jgi:hypothetical protein
MGGLAGDDQLAGVQVLEVLEEVALGVAFGVEVGLTVPLSREEPAAVVFPDALFGLLL